MKIKNRYIILLLFATLLLFASCEDGGESRGGQFDSFAKKTTEGLYLKGYNTLVYNEDLHQIAVNNTAITFRIQDDTQATFFHADLSSIPVALGEYIAVEFTTRGISSIDNDKSYQMELVKQKGETLWLWDKNSQLGIIITL